MKRYFPYQADVTTEKQSVSAELVFTFLLLNWHLLL